GRVTPYPSVAPGRGRRSAPPGAIRARRALRYVGSSEPAYNVNTAASGQPVGTPSGPIGNSAAMPVPAASTAATHRAYRVIDRGEASTALTSARMPAKPTHAAT